MPNYEYLCTKCGHRFEQIRKFSDKPLRKCPECGGLIEQVISAPAVQFKGSGWYVTDYAKKGEGSGGSSSASEGDSSAKLAKETKDAKDTKDTKETKKDDKPKSETSHKKNKKD
ncbi:MAG: zinc ribbon domain-containing protein [Terriglobales bacterium]